MVRHRFICCFLVMQVAGCGDDEGGRGNPGEPDAGGGTQLLCVGEGLALQNPDAHTLGETFYLPRLDGPDCPSGAGWTVAAAPADSRNQVFAEGAPNPRFTPDRAGEYRFEVSGVPEATFDLRVVEVPAAERFRNHYLTPLYGAAIVGDEVWTANGATYSVTRVGRTASGWETLGEVVTGSWPAAVAWRDPLPYAVVAQRGSDTVGFIDRERGVLEDALWVGDEPTGLALSPDATTLYVSLPTMGEVAVVDLAERRISRRIQVGFDPRALALSEDGSRLYVASYRSGNPVADVYGTYAVPDADDVSVIDTATGTIVAGLGELSSVLRALYVADGELYVVGTDGDPIVSQAQGNAYRHELIAVNVDPGSDGFGEVRARVDLTTQASSAGPVVNPGGVIALGDALWVSSEASGTLVRLDRATLEETARLEVGPGARQLVDLGEGALAVHSFESLELWVVAADASVVETVALADDARPAALALGERVFNRPGAGFATNHSCGSCHVETQNEGMIWNFGPSIWHNVRPLQLLASTTPLEWGAYVSSAENFGYQGPSSIVGRPATPEEAEALGQFLASLLGAPRATGHTNLDGSYTEAALRGKALFEGKATCATCHTPPLYTNRKFLDEGKSGEPADVPSLLGVYRHGVYFVRGQARDLATAVDVALDFVDIDLTAAERADLVEFLRQLTPKGSHPGAIWPDLDSAEAVPPEIRPWVEFADPVASIAGRDPATIAADYVTLTTDAGAPVAGQLEVVGNRVWFEPAAPLARGERYRFRVAAGLPFQGGGALEGPRSTRFQIAQAPAGTWPERMTMTITVGGPNGPTQLPFQLIAQDERDNGDLVVELRPLVFGAQQRQQLWLRIDGDRVHLEPFALPISPGGVGNASEVVATISQVDDAGRIANLSGTLRIGGPGIDIPNVPLAIVPAAGGPPSE